MAKKGGKDHEASGTGIGMILFNANVNFAQCRDI